MPNTRCARFLGLSRVIQINKVAKEIEVMMPKIWVEIKEFTLVQDTVRGPRWIHRLTKDGEQMTGPEDMCDRYDG
jgi:hypothetical protein